MRSQLPRIADDLGADERTLRRAAGRGTVRCHRPGPRQLELAAGELDYLRSHWQLLQTLTGVLRTARNVRLAVLYGSAARGDDHRGSDVDLLVQLRVRAPGAAIALSEKIEDALARRVDVVEIEVAQRRAPLLLREALDEGRVLLDRDAQWPARLARRGAVVRAAQRLEAIERRAVERSWQMLVEDAR